MFGYAARISVSHPRTLIDGEDSANLPAVGWDTIQAVHAAAQAVMSGVHDCCVLAASWTETYPFVQLGKQCKSCGKYSALDLCRSVTHAMHTRKQRIYDIFFIYNVTIKYNQSVNQSIDQSIDLFLSLSLSPPLPICIYICILKRHTQTHSQALTLATRWHVQIGAVQDVAKTWRQVRLSFLHTDVLLGGIAGGVEVMQGRPRRERRRWKHEKVPKQIQYSRWSVKDSQILSFRLALGKHTTMSILLAVHKEKNSEMRASCGFL